MVGAVFSLYWSFGLRRPGTGAYRLLGRARSWCQNGRLPESSCQWVLPSTSTTSVLVPTVRHSRPPTSPSDPPRPACRSGPDFCVVTAFSPRSWCSWDLVCSFQEWSFYDQVPLAFKAKCSGGFSFRCQTLRSGCLMWGSELSFLWENLYHVIIFQFVGHPPGGYGIWLYCECTPPTISLWPFLCLWM